MLDEGAHLGSLEFVLRRVSCNNQSQSLFSYLPTRACTLMECTDTYSTSHPARYLFSFSASGDGLPLNDTNGKLLRSTLPMDQTKQHRV